MKEKERVYPVRLPFVLPINEEKSVDRVVYAYLVVGEEVCLVDTGAAGSEQRIVDALATLGKAPSDVAWVVLTHEHPDHIGGNAFFHKAAQPKFACHAEAVRWIEDLDLQYKERPIYGFYTLTGEQPVRITHRLQDGDEIDLGGGTTLQVIFTPGHSPGSISLFCPKERVLIAGDAIPPVGGLPLYVDVDQSRESLHRLAALSGVRTLYSSYSDKPFTGVEIAATFRSGLDYLDRVDAAVAEVMRNLPAGTRPEIITREVLSRLGMETPVVTPITTASILAHLP